MKKTKLRVATDRAAKATEKAYGALATMQGLVPQEYRSDRHERWLADLAEYASYLSAITWPDHVQP